MVKDRAFPKTSHFDWCILVFKSLYNEAIRTVLTWTLLVGHFWTVSSKGNLSICKYQYFGIDLWLIILPTIISNSSLFFPPFLPPCKISEKMGKNGERTRASRSPGITDKNIFTLKYHCSKNVIKYCMSSHWHIPTRSCCDTALCSEPQCIWAFKTC